MHLKLPEGAFRERSPKGGGLECLKTARAWRAEIANAVKPDVPLSQKDIMRETLFRAFFRKQQWKTLTTLKLFYLKILLV
jgi:hypothetical protein